MGWYVTGLAALGLVTGYMLPLSQTPLMTTLLPLIFALAGGAAGIYSLKADFADTAARAKFALIGKSLAAFCVALIAATVFSIHRRDALLENAAPVVSLKDLTPSQALEIAALRKRLEVFGARVSEQRTVLSAAVARARAYNEQTATETLDKAARDADAAALAARKPALASLKAAAAAFSEADLASVQENPGYDAEAVRTLARLGGLVAPILEQPGSEASVRDTLAIIQRAMADAISDPAAPLGALLLNPKATLALYDLGTAIDVYLATFDPLQTDPAGTDPSLKDQDDLIALMLGSEQVVADDFRSGGFYGTVASN